MIKAVRWKTPSKTNQQRSTTPSLALFADVYTLLPGTSFFIGLSAVLGRLLYSCTTPKHPHSRAQREKTGNDRPPTSTNTHTHTLAKWGNVRRLNPYGMRCPSTFCWPTQAKICEMLMKEPFEPASAMALTAFLSLRLTWADVPDSSRAVFSTLQSSSSSSSRNRSRRSAKKSQESRYASEEITTDQLRYDGHCNGSGVGGTPGVSSFGGMGWSNNNNMKSNLLCPV